MAIAKVQFKETASATPVVWMDTTQKTVAADKLLSGETALKNDGTDVVGTVATVEHPKPTATIDSSTGVVTASHTQTTGVVTGGTTTGTLNLTTQAAKTVTPSTSSQTAVAAGRYTTGAVTVAAMPSGTAGTPTATKGTVSNHSISITPSVTNTTGYITGGTKTGTAVTVNVSELESGTKSITENGTGISVSGYSAVDVNVDSSNDFVITLTKNAQTEMWEPTCTYAEAYASYEAGKNLVFTAGDWNNCFGWWSDVEEAFVYSVYEEFTDSGMPSAWGNNCLVYFWSTNGITIDENSRRYDTSLATAIPADVISGKYFYNSQGLQVGTIETKASSDLTASGATVTAPAGYYAEDASKSVESGTAGTPTATKGTVTNHSVTITPSVTNTAGYIPSGTVTGTGVTVSASELVSGNLDITKNGTDINVVNYSTVSVDVSSQPSTTHTATISRTDGLTIPRAQVNGTGTNYGADGMTFTWEDGDNIRFYLGASDYVGNVYVNGVAVYRFESGGYYTFTPPKCDIELTFKRDTSQENAYVYINYDHLAIDDNGAYDVSDYFGVVVKAYETGTWTPSSDTLTTTISFSNTHSTVPFFVEMVDIEKTKVPSYSVARVAYSENIGLYIVMNNTYTGFKNYVWQREDSLYDSETIGYTVESRPMTNSEFTAQGNGTSTYFRAGRTYKWIAVWLPNEAQE